MIPVKAKSLHDDSDNNDNVCVALYLPACLNAYYLFSTKTTLENTYFVFWFYTWEYKDLIICPASEWLSWDLNPSLSNIKPLLDSTYPCQKRTFLTKATLRLLSLTVNALPCPWKYSDISWIRPCWECCWGRSSPSVTVRLNALAGPWAKLARFSALIAASIKWKWYRLPLTTLGWYKGKSDSTPEALRAT